jgi:hypothetical protein
MPREKKKPGKHNTQKMNKGKGKKKKLCFERIALQTSSDQRERESKNAGVDFE